MITLLSEGGFLNVYPHWPGRSEEASVSVRLSPWWWVVVVSGGWRCGAAGRRWGRPGCAGSYWQSCSGFHTAFCSLLLWSSPVGGGARWCGRRRTTAPGETRGRRGGCARLDRCTASHGAAAGASDCELTRWSALWLCRGSVRDTQKKLKVKIPVCYCILGHDAEPAFKASGCWVVVAGIWLAASLQSVCSRAAVATHVP